MIISYDTIDVMQISINTRVINLLLALSEKLGEVNGMHFNHSAVKQEKMSAVASNKACMELIGIDLSFDQVYKLRHHYLIKASKKDVQAARILIDNYDHLSDGSYLSIRDFKKTLKNLASYKLNENGQPEAPSDEKLRSLFQVIKNPGLHLLIKILEFHYEVLRIFLNKNTAIEVALLWQKRMLIHYNALFSFLDYESTLLKYKADYFKLIRRVREGENNEKFFLFLLKVLNESVEDHLRKKRGSHSTESRISLFKQSAEGDSFSRQDYLRKFKFISAITASRDLRFAVESGQFIKKGDKRLARYWIAEKKS